MKKILIKVLCGLLAVSMLFSFTACNSAEKWQGTSMKNWGNVVSNGGFIAETENYLYYVNGVGTSSAKNKFGAPVKGALMAVDKSDFSKTEIVVPKLFVASDYNAGIYIFGDYVYYGTPSTDKNPDGTTASSEMMFMKTKLDGTDSKVLFTVGSLSTEYRIVENNGDVFVVYYDSANTELVSRNVTKGTKTVIAKTDAKTDGDESLNAHFFINNENLDSAVVVYTSTIYTEKYNKDKVDAGVARATANYNKVYAYKAGAESSEVVFDGKATESTVAITLVKGDYVFYSNTNKYSTAKNYGLTVADFVAKEQGVEIVSEYAVKANVIKSLNEVYILDSEGGKIYQDTMVKADQNNESKKLVAMLSSFNSLIDVKDGFAYYYNSSNQIARVELGNKDAKEIRVSEDSATQTWYAPEFITVGEETLMFYCDNSSTGLSYIKYIDINADVKVDTQNDDDETNDISYVDGAKMLGKMIDADKADLYETNVNKISSDLEDGALVFDEELKDGKLVVKAVEDARVAYEDLESDVKEKVSSSVLTTLKNYEKAIEKANLFYQLNGVKDYETLDQAGKDAVKAAYDQVKAQIEKFYQADDSETIAKLIKQDLKANYTKAVKLFETK